MNDVSKKIAKYGCFCALSLILSYVESLIPFSLGIPGAKLGLANCVTVFLLYMLGPVSCVFVNSARILLSGFLFGNLFAVFYSAGGFLFSFLVMVLLKKTGKFSVPAVSAAGGAFHNLGQLLAAVLVTDLSVLSYFPYLLLCGTAAGILIGILSGMIAQRLRGVIK